MITTADIQRRGPGDSLKDAAKRQRFDARVTALQPNSYLTNISVGYSQDGMIADLLAPRVLVENEKGEYPIWGRDAFRAERKTGDTQVALLRTVRTESKSWDATPTTGAYTCEEYALNFLLDDREQGKWADAEMAYTQMVNAAMTLDREIRVANLLGSSTYLTNYTTLSGTSQWSDFTSGDSDPLGAIETGIFTVRKNSGQFANTAFMNPEVYQKLRNHPDLTEMYKVQNGPISDAQLADAIRCGGPPLTIRVGWATYDNTNEGVAFSGAFIWPKYFGLMYVPPAPGILVPATCYQLYTRDRVVVTERVNLKHSDWYELSEIQDEVIPTVQTAYLIVDAVA